MKSINEAKNLLDYGDIQAGKEMLLDLATSEPDDDSIWLLLCGISTRTQDSTLGVQSFERLVQLRPKSGLASSGLVQSYINIDRVKDALDEIARFRSVADLNSEESQIALEEHQRTLDQIDQK